MTTQHWYDDSNGNGGGAFHRNQAFLPVMMGFFCLFYCWNHCVFSLFFNGANCAALEPLSVKSLTAVHSQHLPAASGTSHKGLRVHARMTQLPCLRATRPTSPNMDTGFQQVCSCCKVERKNTLFLTFICMHMCVRACVLTLPPPGYDEKQFRPGWLFPVLVLLAHRLTPGCVIILPQLRKTGWMCKQVAFPSEHI